MSVDDFNTSKRKQNSYVYLYLTDSKNNYALHYAQNRWMYFYQLTTSFNKTHSRCKFYFTVSIILRKSFAYLLYGYILLTSFMKIMFEWLSGS